MNNSNVNFDQSDNHQTTAPNSGEKTGDQTSSEKLKKKHKEFKDILVEKFGNKKVLIWWYGALTKNVKDRSQGNVIVICRLFDENNSLTNKFRYFEFNLTSLVRLRIGSIWLNGEQTAFRVNQIRKFKINHAAFKKIYIKAYSQTTSKDQINFLEYNAYEVFESDLPTRKTNCILFETVDDTEEICKEFGNLKGIAIPSFEFLIRGYGLSSELPRILTTYNETERDERLYYQDITPPDENIWPVILGPRLTEEDVIFIAYYKYANARKTANTLFNSITIDSQYKNIYPDVSPWHDQTTEIEVAGFYLEKEQIFVAHTILGIEPPDHSKVESIPKTKKNEDENEDEDGPSYPYISPELNKDIPLIQLENVGGKRSRQQPTIKLGSFEWLGDGLHVKKSDLKYEIKKPKGGVPNKEETNKYGLSEPDNRNDVVNKTAVPKTTNAPASMKLSDNGRLLNMWQACLSAQKIRSNDIKSVSYFTFQGNFETSDEDSPKLIAFNKVKNKWHLIKNWEQQSINRGLFVIRLELDPKGAKFKNTSKKGMLCADPLYLIEIQPTIILDNDKKKESGHSGFIFQMKETDADKFPTFIKEILGELPESKGSFKKLLNHSYLEKAEIFKHSHSSDLDEARSSLKNALGKMSIHINFKEPEKKKKKEKRKPSKNKKQFSQYDHINSK